MQGVENKADIRSRLPELPFIPGEKMLMRGKEQGVSILTRSNRKLIRPVLSVATAYGLAIQMLLAAVLGGLTIQQAIASDGYPVICYGASSSQDSDDGSKQTRLHSPPCVICALGALDNGTGPSVELTVRLETRAVFASLRRDDAVVARLRSPRMSQGPPGV